MSAAIYADTSALAKWYLPEAGSEEVEAFLRGRETVSISRLGVVEMHCLLNRRTRLGQISARHQARIVERFDNHIAEGYVTVHPLEDRHARTASALVARLKNLGLRTLDAIHLAAAQDARCTALMTADQTMAQAGEELKMTVHRF